MIDAVPSTASDRRSDTVLVLLATLNGSRYLEQQLDSIAAQTHPHWMLTVSDDGSTDDSLEIVQQFSRKHPGRVTIVGHDPAGSARDNFFNLLYGARAASYFALCDQDDVWSVHKLERLVRRCMEHEEKHQSRPCLVYSDLAVVGADLEPLHPSFFTQIRALPQAIDYRTLLTENAIPGCAMLFNRALFDVFRAHEFDRSSAVMHDWWIALLASTIGDLLLVREPLVLYRQHENNTLGTVKRSGISFALSKLVDGDRSASLQTYKQAGAFISAYGELIDPKIARVIRAFAALPQQNKIQRVRQILRCGTLKQTLARRVYQLVRA